MAGEKSELMCLGIVIPYGQESCWQPLATFYCEPSERAAPHGGCDSTGIRLDAGQRPRESMRISAFVRCWVSITGRQRGRLHHDALECRATGGPASYQRSSLLGQENLRQAIGWEQVVRTLRVGFLSDFGVAWLKRVRPSQTLAVHRPGSPASPGTLFPSLDPPFAKSQAPHSSELGIFRCAAPCQTCVCLSRTKTKNDATITCGTLVCLGCHYHSWFSSLLLLWAQKGMIGNLWRVRGWQARALHVVDSPGCCLAPGCR